MAHPFARLAPGPDHLLDPDNERVLVQLERGEIPWLKRDAPDATDIRRSDGGDGAVEAAFLDLFAATGIDFRLGAVRTFYSRDEDMIALSDWRGRDPADHLRDWVHELIHATGHPSRLDRELPVVFGSTGHGAEDLIAEIATASVCASLGIAPSLRHPDSVERWIDLLRADDRIFGHAVRAAGAATAYLLARRDAQAAAFDRIEAEEAAAMRDEAARAVAARRRRRREESERWASGLVTGLGPRESLPAARHGDPTWQNPTSSSF
jgi:antirestriction protein ArdC